ncbi:MAG: hypothetical protein IJU66_05725 [Oscillospiraceae bacterium]|nr:hypothetical protein [Oscillospiraceae bacterium]
MLGTTIDGKTVLVNRDFTIHIPYGAGYDVYETSSDQLTVLTVTRFEELPVDYTDGSFQPRGDLSKCDVLNLTLTHALSVDSLGQMQFRDFLANVKRSTDEKLASVAVGTAAANADGENYSVLKVVQDTPEIKAGYITNDLYVAANFMTFIFTRNHVYQATMKIPRQKQKFKRTEMYMMSLLSGIKPN